MRATGVATMALLSTVAACTDPPSSSAMPSSDTTEGSPMGASTTMGEDSTGTVMGSPGCLLPMPSAGTHREIPIEFDGMTRSYDLFVPDSYRSDRPAPLVLNFHGHLGSPMSQAAGSGFDAFAQPRGMLVAYPQGLGASWNGGPCCGPAYVFDEDDVGFAVAVVDQVAAQACVDLGRVYAMGVSNGAQMVQRIACEAADRFVAVASVAGVLGLEPAECTPSQPVGVAHVHGTADVFMPYEGNGPGYPAVPQMMADWAARDGCEREPITVSQQAEVLCQAWPSCADEVQVSLCTVQGGGHCWPGNGQCPRGQGTEALDTSAMIAAFFDAHVRR